MIQYYLIHGIDSHRKPFMEDQFQRFGIPANTVKWITHPNKNDYIPNGICIKSDLPRGHIACTYKHYLILKDIVENQYPLAVIMEDNIEFRGNVPEALSRYLNDLPANWDCVFDSDYFGMKYSG
jgi:GR25 family glycosyltransferase involved in LPS biosynthesis